MSVEKTSTSKMKAAEKSTPTEGKMDIGDCGTDSDKKSAMRKGRSGWERRGLHEEVSGQA